MSDRSFLTYARGGKEEPTQSGWTPKYVVAHDYGGSPQNKDGVFNPYNTLVFPDGSVRYRNPSDPYGVKAPHAYKLNPYSVGLSYAGPVGGKPTPEGMATLRREYEAVRQRYPGIQMLGHGEAFKHFGHGHAMQASKDGRDIAEASWRNVLNGGVPSPVPAPRPQTPTVLQTADKGYAPDTRQIAQPSSITPGAMRMPGTNTIVMSDKDSGGSLTLPNFQYPGSAEAGWNMGHTPSVSAAGSSGERVLNPSSGAMDSRLGPADNPATSGIGYRDQPPMAATGAPQSKPYLDGKPFQPQWVNGTYGQGVQWGNGDTSFTQGGGQFKAGALTDKPKPNLGMAAPQMPAQQSWNPFKSLFGG